MQMKAFLFYLISSVISICASDNTLEARFENQGKAFKFYIYPANNFLADVFLDEKLLISPLVHFDFDLNYNDGFVEYLRENLDHDSRFIEKSEETYFEIYNAIHKLANYQPEERIKVLANLHGHAISMFAWLRLNDSLNCSINSCNKTLDPKRNQYDEKVKKYAITHGFTENDIYMLEATHIVDYMEIIYARKWGNHVRNLHQSAPLRLRELSSESNNIMHYIQLTEKIINIQKKHNFPPISQEDFSKIFRQKIRTSFKKIIDTHDQLQTDSNEIEHIKANQKINFVLQNYEGLSPHKAEDLFEPYVQQVGETIEKSCQPMLEGFEKIRNPTAQSSSFFNCTIL